MSAIVFETPGLIDVRAFTIMGVHAKPNSANPIGYFGTGLKYALAVLVRLGCEPVVWIGQDQFSFSKLSSTFRGSPLETIRMRVLKAGQRRASFYELPFTTAYGKNWKAWQAFRELESNTRDEGGHTFKIDSPIDFVGGEPGKTVILVDLPEFVEAWENRDDVFLPGSSREGKGILECLPGESKRLWYRSMRALDLSKPTLFTYNFLEKLELTEDRTLKYEYSVKNVLARWVLSEATAGQVEAILKVDEDGWEYGLEFPGYVTPSEAFRFVMTERRKGVSRNAHSYYSTYMPTRTIKRPTGFSLYETHPKPWKVDMAERCVVDAMNDPVFAMPEDAYEDDWRQVAEAIIKRLDVLPLPAVAIPTPVDIMDRGVADYVHEYRRIDEDDSVPF